MKIAFLAPILAVGAHAQAPAKLQFEVASIKPNAPQSGFHFAADAATGGPGTADPGMFRCSRCSLATLILRAFRLQPYQFPDRKAMTDNTYDVAARIPAGTGDAEFSEMLQNLLRDRFGLAWHFQEKKLKGYELVVANEGPKLTPSGAKHTEATTGGWHGAGSGESHNHSGAIAFGTSAMYRANNQTTTELARVLSDQLGLPVEDRTGLPGKYDISLRWSADAAPTGAPHGGPGHSEHETGGADPAGPTLFGALQQQLGLKLVSARQVVAQLIVIDRVAPTPTEND